MSRASAEGETPYVALTIKILPHKFAKHKSFCVKNLRQSSSRRFDGLQRFGNLHKDTRFGCRNSLSGNVLPCP